MGNHSQAQTCPGHCWENPSGRDGAHQEEQPLSPGSPTLARKGLQGLIPKGSIPASPKAGPRGVTGCRRSKGGIESRGGVTAVPCPCPRPLLPWDGHRDTARGAHGCGACGAGFAHRGSSEQPGPLRVLLQGKVLWQGPGSGTEGTGIPKSVPILPSGMRRSCAKPPLPCRWPRGGAESVQGERRTEEGREGERRGLDPI